MPKRDDTLTPEQLLERYPAPMRSLAEQLRVLVRGTVPEASEYVNAGWCALAYRHPVAGYFCGIFPFADHVKLLFEHGVELDDPADLLEGDGRQVRSIVMRRPADARRRGVRPLLLAAVALRSVPQPRPKRRPR
ncbi:MAG: DUF1801 domain-containing protein [Candidatus Eisenbacteria bacterium]